MTHNPLDDMPTLEERYPHAAYVTLRDRFAMAALSGLTTLLSKVAPGKLMPPEMLVASAYEFADAMMRERAK
jgi:hypothetical protein